MFNQLSSSYTLDLVQISGGALRVEVVERLASTSGAALWTSPGTSAALGPKKSALSQVSTFLSHLNSSGHSWTCDLPGQMAESTREELV